MKSIKLKTMSSELLDFFTNFKTENLIDWTKKAISFFRNPSHFVNDIAQKPSSEILPQYSFYFLIYAFSFIFFSLGFSIGDVIKPAILNISLIIPQILLFSLSSWFATKKSYFKKVAIFLLSLNFFLSPFIYLLYSLFLNSETYIYKLIMSSLLALASLIIVFAFGFIVETNRKIALKLVIVNYLFINALFLISLRINFDRDGGIVPPLYQDSIYDEYASFAKNLRSKDKIPVTRFYFIHGNKIFTRYATHNLVSDTLSFGGDSVNEIYEKDVSYNIKLLRERAPDLKFIRNKKTCDLWLDYFNSISLLINYKIQNKDELKGRKDLVLITADSSAHYYLYSGPIPIDSTFSLQLELKKLHNNLIKVSKASNYPNEISQKATFILGYILDDLIFRIFDEGKMRPYKDLFLDI